MLRRQFLTLLGPVPFATPLLARADFDVRPRVSFFIPRAPQDRFAPAFGKVMLDWFGNAGVKQITASNDMGFWRSRNVS